MYFIHVLLLMKSYFTEYILELFSFCHFVVKIILQDYFNSVFLFQNNRFKIGKKEI